MINKLVTWLFLKVRKTHDERTFVLRHLHERDEVLLPRNYYERLKQRVGELNSYMVEQRQLRDEIEELKEQNQDLQIKLQAAEAQYNQLKGKTSHIEAIRKNSLRK